MYRRLVISLGLIFVIASLLSWPVTYIGVNFFAGVLFFSTIQIVTGYFYRDYMEKKIAIEQEKLIIAREAELSKQGTTVVCPCDKAVQCFVPIRLNEPNEYNCPTCKKQVNIRLNFKTAIATIPVIEDPQTLLLQQLHNLKDADGIH